MINVSSLVIDDCKSHAVTVTMHSVAQSHDSSSASLKSALKPGLFRHLYWNSFSPFLVCHPLTDCWSYVGTSFNERSNLNDEARHVFKTDEHGIRAMRHGR